MNTSSISPDRADLEEFARLVQKMRAKQNDYFRKGRTPADLAESRALEREVDRAAVALLSGPSPLLPAFREIHQADQDRTGGPKP